MAPRSFLRLVSVLALGFHVAGSAGTPVPLTAQQSGPRQSSGSAGQSRTRLADGRWLVVGGEGVAGSAATWDPRTQIATPTAGAPIAPRAWHTATLLADGTVLLAGGRNDRGLVANAEIFEPVSGTFRQVSIAGATPRASHSATLLADGSVVIAGGTADANVLSVERWDLAAQTASTLEAARIDRSGHTATLESDETVRIAGGRRADGQPGSDVLRFDPASGSVAPVVPQERGNRPARLAGSIPATDAEDVAVEAHVALQFSDALDPASVTGDSVTLTGPDGPLATMLVPAEDGRLVFVWPGAPLAEGATYVVTVAGLADASGRAVPAASIRFTTKARATDGSTPIDAEAWTPNSGDRENGWRTNRPPSPWETLAPLMASPGVTAVSGRVLRLDGRPLPEVTLGIDGRQVRTDRTGRFLLSLDGSSGRLATLAIDARTANQPNRTYGYYEALVSVRGGRTNVLPFTIWSPLIDTAHEVTLASPTTAETVVTSPLVPGLELHLPAGTVVKDKEHNVARTVSITAIPLDRTPFPMPDNATFSMFFTIQPGGAYLSTPGPIRGGWLVYPNVRGSRDGSRVQFFNYDPRDKGWYPYGMGTITGAQVLPDAKTRLYGFTGASFNDGTPAPPAGPPPGDCCGNSGDPVSLASGTFSYEMTDLVVPDVMPLVLTRTYNSRDPYPRAFGIGMSHSYGLFERSEVWHSEADLYLPDGAKIHFDRISDPSLPTEQTVFEHTATPTRFYKARMTFWGDPIRADDHGWNVTLMDGTVYVFPHAGSPLQAIRDRHGNEVRLTWGQFGRLERVTSPNGRWLAFTYGPGGRISEARDNIGRSVGYTYDANGRLSTVTDPEDHVTSYTWNANDQMVTVKPPHLQGTPTSLVTNEYTTAADAPTPIGWVKKQTLADGGVYEFDYTVVNGKSSQTEVINPRGYLRRVTFNPDGYTLIDRRAIGQPEEQSTTNDRPGPGNFVTSHTNSRGDLTTTERDTLGRVWRVTRLPGTADEAITTYTYDSVWKTEIATITDALNHTMTFEYDAAGNRESVIDALNHKTTYAYNTAGRLTAVIDPLLHETTYDYAGPDLVKITDPLQRITHRFVDAGGRLLGETDPAGQTTRFTYNKLNQTKTHTDPLGVATIYGYDAGGRLASITDALTHPTVFGYDAFDRLSSRTDPLSKTETYSYDLNGNPAQHTDRKGQATVRLFDALDRLHQIAYADGSTITYTYDAGNRLTVLDDSVSGQITRSYDALDRLTSEVTPAGSVDYTYDKAGRRTTMTVTGQAVVTYDYDDANRMTSVTQGTSTVTIAYDDADRRSTLELPNGVKVTYGYDAGSQLTSLTYTVGPATLGTLTYAYDLAGRRTAVGGSWARTGLPPAVAAAQYDAANRLTQWAGVNFDYDQTGNLASSGFTSYGWDARNQLATVSGPTASAFQYDAIRRRVARTSGGQTVQFLYDGSNSVQEGSNGTPTGSLLGGVTADERWRRTDSQGAAIYLVDALGSPIALTDGSGTVLTQYTYEPFGRTQTSGAASANLYQFTGRENESPITDLYYYRARYYAPESGRFISEDPIGVGGGNVNFYVYAFNDPLNLTDPFGLDTQQCTRPLNNVPMSTTLPPHVLLASTQARRGAGLGPAEGMGIWMTRPGRIEWEEPYSPDGTVKPGYSCTTVSRKQCVEDCVMKRLREDSAAPPNYRVGAMTCDVYATRVLTDCEKQCGGKK